MSYEKQMLSDLLMPSKQSVQEALLKALFSHNGTIKEFGTGEEIVDELAIAFGLSKAQRTAQLETIYRKENRLKKSSLWHRLLFRAADDLAKDGFIQRPSETVLLTGTKEWMLTEKGYDKALNLFNIPLIEKENLAIKSYEVEQIAKRLLQSPRPKIYEPIEPKKKKLTLTEQSIRNRGFRQAVIAAYDFSCSVCGFKLNSPNGKVWEVQAAHIVPHSANGKDDILNGLALCHLHHWAFDAGWFSLNDDYSIIVSRHWDDLPLDFGRIGYLNILNSNQMMDLSLPREANIYPHIAAMQWHRTCVFNKINML